MHKFLSFLLLCCLCLLPCHAHAADTAEQKRRAADLLQAGNGQEAYAAFMDLLRQAPDDFEINLGLARSAALNGKYNHALLAYERLVEAVPDNAVLRLEYANQLLAAGRNEQAAEQLAEVRRLDPDLENKKTRLALKGMEDQLSTFQVRGRLAGGYIYDSNINTGPALRGVEVGGIPLRLDKASKATEASGGYLHGAVDVAWRANNESPWWVVGDATGYQRWYDSDNPQRDLTFGRAAAGLRYLRDNTLAEIRLKTDSLLINGIQAVNLYGAEGMFIQSLRHDLQLMLRGGVEHREDLDLKDKNGTYAWGGPYGRWFFGDANHNILFGAKFYGAATEKKQWDFTGFEPGVNVFLYLPFETELILSGAWHHEQYHGPATIFDGSDRVDRQWRVAALGIKKLAEYLQLEVGWQYTDNKSNSDLYTYDQHMLTVGIALSF
ncbi:tetratricopeptide repeat protein [Desulfovibrio sp. OttesenSCG-928-F20]|nr:tetratricopeptide repeat protein [Desulfovibrio sp. OttesenSCG-928-F20]